MCRPAKHCWCHSHLARHPRYIFFDIDQWWANNNGSITCGLSAPHNLGIPFVCSPLRMPLFHLSIGLSLWARMVLSFADWTVQCTAITTVTTAFKLQIVNYIFIRYTAQMCTDQWSVTIVTLSVRGLPANFPFLHRFWVLGVVLLEMLSNCH